MPGTTLGLTAFWWLAAESGRALSRNRAAELRWFRKKMVNTLSPSRGRGTFCISAPHSGGRVVLKRKGLVDNTAALRLQYFNLAASGDGVDAPKVAEAPAKTATGPERDLFRQRPVSNVLKQVWLVAVRQVVGTGRLWCGRMCVSGITTQKFFARRHPHEFA